MGYFLCGHYCVRYLTNECGNRRFGIIGFIAGYAISLWGLVEGLSTSLVHVMAVVSLFLLLKSCVVPEKLTSQVNSSGRYTYVIYFVHVPLVGMLCIMDIWSWCPLWIQPLVITLISYLISYLAAWCFHRIRLIPNGWVGI